MATGIAHSLLGKFFVRLLVKLPPFVGRQTKSRLARLLGMAKCPLPLLVFVIGHACLDERGAHVACRFKRTKYPVRMRQVGFRRGIVELRRPRINIAEQRHVGREARGRKRYPANRRSKLASKSSLGGTLGRKLDRSLELKHMGFLGARKRYRPIALAREFIAKRSNGIEIGFVKMARQHRCHILDAKQAIGTENERHIVSDRTVVRSKARGKQPHAIPYSRRVIAPIAQRRRTEYIAKIEGPAPIFRSGRIKRVRLHEFLDSVGVHKVVASKRYFLDGKLVGNHRYTVVGNSLGYPMMARSDFHIPSFRVIGE